MRVLITGAATGIGAATVARLKRAGHEVTAFDIVEPDGVDRYIHVDMSNMAAIREAAGQVEGAYDALIGNAGLPPRDGLGAKILAVNVFGLIAMTEALLPRLAEGGAIVNTASRAGQDWRANLDQVKRLLALGGPDGLADFIASEGIDDTRAYNLSKEAVIVWGMGASRRLAARGLRVNTVSPAAVETRILGDFKNAFGDRATKGIALAGRPGASEEIAEVIAFLASPASGWIKGADITVDGGTSAMVMAQAMGFEN